jgi:hypothetical protein
MKKLNCWEAKQCGREPGGHKSREFGICPSSVETRLGGIHGGKNAGRACWVIAGTMCGGKEQGSFAQKYHNCEKCDFYLQVRREEEGNFVLSVNMLALLKRPAPPLQSIMQNQYAGRRND